MKSYTRRQWLGLVGSAGPVYLVGRSAASYAGGFLALEVPSPSEVQKEKQKRLGVGMHSYGFQWGAARNNSGAKFRDALTFLEYCHGIGAGGVQVAIGMADAAATSAIRKTAETYGMYVEGQMSLPGRESEVERFEVEVRAAKAAGAEVIRTALLGGRRYETFGSRAAFDEFAKRSWESVVLAEPVVKKHGIRLAIENHKDRRVPELLELLKRLSSEFVGVCVDLGNSIALLEDPMGVVQSYAPWAVSTHVKDMAVEEYEDGFLLSEVPMGEGFLDLAGMMALLRRSAPKVRFNLEMITRDPLKVPCLTERYWATMDKAGGQELARTLRMVRQNKPKQPLPRVSGLSLEQKLKLEDDNVRRSVDFTNRHLL